ncbi:MAG TPA: hypothetical protein P5335_11575 [Flavobacterium sp.]|nr:hypothetical protein [Flavobacterium sp.]HRZ75565.1 hypothetical protein [Flavobacterium sp.]
MKNFKNYLLLIFAVFFVACASEEEITSTTSKMPEAAKTPEMTNFRNSMIEWLKIKNSPSFKINVNAEKEEKTKNDILLENAELLLIANGLESAVEASKKREDNASIITMALQLYAEKTKIVTSN